MALETEIKVKTTEVETLKNRVKTLRAKIESDGDKAAGEDRTQLNNLVDQGMKVREELDKLIAEQKLMATPLGTPPTPGANDMDRAGRYDRGKSWGATVLNSPEFKSIKASGARELSPVEVGIMRLSARKAMKAIYEALSTQGGAAVFPQFLPDIFSQVNQRPLRIVDLVNVSQTTSDLVEYVILTSRTNNAAVVSEFTGGAFGLKPESDLALDLKQAPVKTIATWVGASRQILDDAPRLRDLIDNELTYMVGITLENQILAGDGTGTNFTGILSTSGIQTRVHATSGRAASADDQIADTLERAITDLELEFYEPDAIVLHPTQGEALELLKDDVNHYLNVYDDVTARLWRVPVVETPAMTSGTALVGNFGLGATLWDRMAMQILTGQPNDYFLRNAWAILGEIRAAFAVTRPKAFEKVTGL